MNEVKLVFDMLKTYYKVKEVDFRQNSNRYINIQATFNFWPTVSKAKAEKNCVCRSL